MQSKSFVVGTWSEAASSADNDCPGGVNIPWAQQRLKDLAALGYSQKDIEALASKAAQGFGRGEMSELMANRGRIKGKPVNALAHPAAVADPHLNDLGGKFGYGFNLDGRGDAPGAFEDPVTHETGIDHQLFRALGCVQVFRGTIDHPPTYWTYMWGQLKDSQPAWLVTISGEDLAKDGPVTITFDRAIEHLKSNVDGSPRSDTTYRIDPDTRSHNVYQGRIKSGTVTLDDPGAQDFSMLQNPLMVPVLRLAKVHMRLTLKDGVMKGLLGGYQPWSDIYFSFASGGPGGENCVFGDIPGLYYLLKKHADGEPDPKTGQNTAISAAYQFDAVPVFTVPAESASASAQ